MKIGYDIMRWFAGGVTLVAALSAAAVSPYISKVFDFCPAPGQFVNTLPEYEAGDSYSDMVLKAEEQLAGEARPGMVCLGAFGGYVVFGFDHPVANVEGEYDFQVYSNAMISSQHPRGGSCEPGTVWVSADANGNGLPDDPWYQLRGSEDDNPATIHSFRIVYHRPSSDHVAVADPANRAVTDMEYIRWTSDNATRSEGYICRNMFHGQNYWPEWIASDEFGFEGTLLPDNAVDLSGTGANWLLQAYGEGYVDNLPDAENPGFDIGRAVDVEGRPVKLAAIDFVKVQTAMLQNCGWLGETSTEVCGAEDLHPEAQPESGLTAVETDSFDGPCMIYTTDGVCVYSGAPPASYRDIGLRSGIYIIYGGERRKLITR